MKVFISWSGDTSKAIGSILHKFLPLILQDVDAFMSRHDIESGARWAERIQQELEQSSYGLILLTRSNLNAKWLLFEAGAISKLRNSATACLLCGALEDTEVTGPLAQFQFQKFEQASFSQLIYDMNRRIAKPLGEKTLSLVLEKWWPDIEVDYHKAIAEFASQETEEKNPRNEREFQDEILRMLQIAVRPKEPSQSDMFSTAASDAVADVGFKRFWNSIDKQTRAYLASLVDCEFSFSDSPLPPPVRSRVRDELRVRKYVLVITTKGTRGVRWRFSDSFNEFLKEQVPG